MQVAFIPNLSSWSGTKIPHAARQGQKKKGSFKGLLNSVGRAVLVDSPTPSPATCTPSV